MMRLGLFASTRTPVRGISSSHAGAGGHMMGGIILALAATMLSLLVLPAHASSDLEARHGIAMYGTPKHAADFKAYDFVNPDAPKGGDMRHGVVGTFDSLNPFLHKGSPVWWVWEHTVERLMDRSKDEPFTLYGRLAKTVNMPDDRSFIRFNLDEDARFSDGTPVTSDDVIHTLKILREHGRPNYRNAYKRVVRIERHSPKSVTFHFADGKDRELPLIIGLMPVLQKASFSAERLQKTFLTPVVGSGPYIIEKVEPGVRVVFRRNPDYWGKDKAFARGRFNFNTRRYEYYRDFNTMFESFKRGDVDMLFEQNPGRWATQYDFPAIKDGRVTLGASPIRTPSNPNGFVFNTRKPLFQNKKTREALTYLFDFEWINKTLFHGLYARTQGYWDNSSLSSIGRKTDAFEAALLARYKHDVSAAVLSGQYRMPVTNGSGSDRKTLGQALKLFKQAGWTFKGRKLVHAKTQKPMVFEFLAATKDQERLALAYQRTLKRLGIDMRIRTVDASHYDQRVQTFDYDMIQYGWYQSLSPGNEQTGRWGSASADIPGSFNRAGVKQPLVDAAIASLLSAKDMGTFTSSVRLLDRALISGHYIIPLFHVPDRWFAYWNRLGRPETPSLYGEQLDAWWVKPTQ